MLQFFVELVDVAKNKQNKLDVYSCISHFITYEIYETASLFFVLTYLFDWRVY